MDDCELLELAAKAIGYEFQFNLANAGQLFKDGEYVKFWNPLTDDGDALRLAVNLKLVVCVMPIGVTGIYLPAEHLGGKYDVTEPHENDPYAATRRAIVRVAAEIGRSMP